MVDDKLNKTIVSTVLCASQYAIYLIIWNNISFSTRHDKLSIVALYFIHLS